MTDDQLKEIVKKCLEMRHKAYTPYSNFNVGAALLCKNGKVYTGCNIEVSTYTPTSCAERTAIFKAVSEGEREFEAIAISGGLGDGEPTDYCPPCGVCREVMNEFCDADFKILLCKSQDEVKQFTLAEMLPNNFTSLKEQMK